jgi:glycosyltransferase involved in cell wall biosynthesis
MKPRVLFLSGREVDYMRNRVLLAALHSFSDVTVLTGAGSGVTSRTASGLIRYITARPAHDVCFAGFFGQPIAIALSALQRKPIVLDAFISAYDTLCEDRRRFQPRSLPGRLAYWLDQHSCRASSQVLTDTCASAHYFQQTFSLDPGRFSTVYVGCDETIFYPRLREKGAGSRVCEVFYYGAFLPLHGTDGIARAAALLGRRSDIHWTLGGDGPGFTRVSRLVSDLGLTNVTMPGWIPIEEVAARIAAADICLGGHFSTIPKAGRVISTKTFQFLAMKKAVIVGDNRATRELLAPGRHALAVPMGDPAALAQAVETLADDSALRDRLGEAAYDLFCRRLTTSAIAEQLAGILERAQTPSRP